MRANLEMADPRLQEGWQSIYMTYIRDHPGHDILLTCTYRSPAEQAILYAQGRTAPGRIVTHCDGLIKASHHNTFPSHALDFCVLVYGKVSWDEREYMPVGLIAESLGLIWGGSWHSFKDYPHVELPKGL